MCACSPAAFSSALSTATCPLECTPAVNFLAKEPAVECGAAASNLSLCPLFPTRLSFDMADNEPYGEPAEGERVERRRRERVKKPPVPVLPDGTWVQIGDSCRSSTLQGQVGTVVAWGRQVEVLLRGPDGAEGDVRKINPTDLVALSEEPGFTAAEAADDRSIRDSGDTTSSD